jgi:hypothetical protein
MVTVYVVVTAHCPAEGVNVYTPEFILSTMAGLHVPLMPFTDVPGNDGTAAPAQKTPDVPNANVGVMFGVTVTEKLYITVHCPASGVNI